MAPTSRLRQFALRCNAAVEREWRLALVVLWGIIVRCAYFAATPFYDRAYDTQGHIDYIVYVVKNFRIPALGSGWEMHQPPFYYFVAGSWVKAGLFLGRTTNELSFDLRILSLLLSVATLGMIAWIATMLFADRRKLIIPFTLIVGTLPGIVMLTSRINNDVLATFLAFLWFGFMLRWHRDRRTKDLWISAVLIGLGMLTKFSAGFLALPMVVWIAVTKNLMWKRKFELGGIVVIIILLISGWYFAFRSWEHLQVLFLPGTSGLNQKLVVDNQLLDYVLFNPISLVRNPFTSPWDTFPDRRYIWEYLLRSAFFGEWFFMNILLLARAIIVFAITGLIAFCVGIKETWRTWTAAVPLIVLFLALLFTLGMFRGLHPCACDQDFRYIPLLSVPITAFALMGFASRQRRGTVAMWIWAGGLTALQCAFLLSFIVM